MGTLALIGHILFGGFFVIGGAMHFMKLSDMTSYTRAKGVPLPQLAVMGTGLVILLAGLGVIFDIRRTLAYLVLAAFLLVVTPIMHAFWSETDPNMKMVDMQMFLKNMALLGAALVFYTLAV